MREFPGAPVIEKDESVNHRKIWRETLFHKVREKLFYERLYVGPSNQFGEHETKDTEQYLLSNQQKTQRLLDGAANDREREWTKRRRCEEDGSKHIKMLSSRCVKGGVSSGNIY